MKYDIREMIDRCEMCQRMRPSKLLEPFIRTEATFPMEMLSADLFQAKGQHYLVIADRYSGYIWVDRLRDQSTKAITDRIDRIIRVFGVPLACRTDGGAPIPRTI